LFTSSAAILSHDIVHTKTSRDNIYNYANQTALSVCERTFEEQTSLPSNKSVRQTEPPLESRNRILAQCLAKGWVQFSTQRISATGKTVLLNDAVLFNLFDEYGLYRGQAVVFDPIT